MMKEIKYINIVVKYMENKMSPKERRSFKSLLKSDKELAEMYKLISGLKNNLDTADAFTLLAPLENLSSKMFSDYNKAKKEKEIDYGVKIYDSKVIPLPAGIRPSAVDTRRMNYKFDNFELNLSLYPISFYSYEMIGNIDTNDDNDEYILKLTNDDETFETQTDETCTFRFPRISISTYNLYVLKNNRAIAVAEIEL